MVSDYDAAAVRSVLREHGQHANERGRLSNAEKEAYERIRSGAPAAEDVTTADGDDLDDAASDAGTETVRAETIPRRPPRSRGKGGGGLLRLVDSAREGKAKSKGKAKPARKRISLERLVAQGYARAGQMLTVLSPPTGRCLQAQSAMAGVILEDVLRDTLADRLLQPMARAQDKGEKMLALGMPPVLVYLIDASQGLPEEEARKRQAILFPLLRESLLISMEVTGKYAKQVEARVAKAAEDEQRIDELLAMIFGQPETAGAAA